MDLFVLRHGHAESYASSDALRKLSARGQQEVHKVLQHRLSALGKVQKIFVSPYVRAQQTADIVQEYLPQAQRFESDLLIPSTEIDALAEMLQEQTAKHPGAAVLLVSHQPLVNLFLEGLCGLPSGHYRMDTAALTKMHMQVIARNCAEFCWLQQAQL